MACLCGEVGPGLLDLPELHHGADADEEAKGEHQPPQPGVLVPDDVGAALHDERPLGEGEAEARQGAVPRRDGVAEAHQQHEANLHHGLKYRHHGYR